MIDDIDRLKIKRALKDEAFWIAVLPLLASLHPDARDFLAERWELIAVLLGYLVHNGYLRGKTIKGAGDVLVQRQPIAFDPAMMEPVHEPLPYPGQEQPDGE